MRGRAGCAVAVAVALNACTGAATAPHPSAGSTSSTGPAADAVLAATKIKRIVVVMQENRSFDSYFGTYPGADGIPMSGGVPQVCVPDPASGCQRPFHDTADVNGAGPHGHANAVADADGGEMDGFIGQAQKAKQGCSDPNKRACTGGDTRTDVMGYRDGGDILNYWAYAHAFVLQDHMFEPNASWSVSDFLGDPW